ncbi:TadE/TadG family type IV pilus assembly protein [Sphingopyxis alaskensis]|jgi:Flp pilus assembly protein TadG|uniref:TadE/TadG family type IV pilus assembly protein n=1 Tax=Sphingopyxis alaskensis TaxID=117207 RepID=UPI0020400924|nr:TadE family protein [Sphingopyxis alaskensis]MCM3417814.1 pilus assembly protein [Sphingopyxis alaskensis]
MTRRSLPAFVRCRSGAAAAEMALILPMLIAIMFGGFEGGAYLWTEHKVVKAVRDGARFAARQSFSVFDCSGITDTTVRTQVQNLTRTGQPSGGTAKIAGWTNDQVSVTAACRTGESYSDQGVYATEDSGAIHVTVSATVPYPSLFGTLGFNTTGATVTASANAAVMGI